MRLSARSVPRSSSVLAEPFPIFIDQHPCFQTSTLSRQTTLLRLRSFPWHPRARIYPSQHSTSTWQGLYQSFLGWGDRESERRLGEISEYCCRSSVAPGISFSVHCLAWGIRNLLLNFRLEAKYSALSYKTPPGTGRNGSKRILLVLKKIPQCKNDNKCDKILTMYKTRVWKIWSELGRRFLCVKLWANHSLLLGTTVMTLVFSVIIWRIR